MMSILEDDKFQIYSVVIGFACAPRHVTLSALFYDIYP
jgi:hypothetical protein